MWSAAAVVQTLKYRGVLEKAPDSIPSLCVCVCVEFCIAKSDVLCIDMCWNGRRMQ